MGKDIKLHNLLQKQMTRRQFLGLGAVAVASFFGVAGLLRQLNSKAAAAFLAAEPEQGTASSPAITLSDGTAAGGSAIKFASPPAANRDNLVYGNYKPSAATVGPLPGTTLAAYGSPNTSTDYVASANGQIIENLEIWGSLNLKTFSNVTVRNCVIHGTLNRGTDTAHIISQGDDLRGATIVDCALVGRPVTVPATYNGVANPDAGRVNLANEWCGGIRGGNYTILRTEITNTSDGLGLTSQLGNVTAKGCWIHNGWFNEWAAAQGSNGGGNGFYPYAAGTTLYTHVDGIQFHRGRNYTFVGNRIGGNRVPGDHNASPSQKDAINSGDDMYNSALMIKQEVDNTAANKIENVLIDRNWLAGGVCTINITLGRGNYLETVNVTNNRFTRSTWGNHYYVLRQHDAAGRYVGNFSGNVFEDDGSAIPISNGGTASP